MENPITEAVKLMFTGMGTVFLILIFVVLLGKLIIIITNKYSEVPAEAAGMPESKVSVIEPKKLAAIISTVENVTLGKGSITSIKKIN